MIIVIFIGPNSWVLLLVKSLREVTVGDESRTIGVEKLEGEGVHGIWGA